MRGVWYWMGCMVTCSVQFYYHLIVTSFDFDVLWDYLCQMREQHGLAVSITPACSNTEWHLALSVRPVSPSGAAFFFWFLVSFTPRSVCSVGCFTILFSSSSLKRKACVPSHWNTEPPGQRGWIPFPEQQGSLFGTPASTPHPVVQPMPEPPSWSISCCASLQP